jgi:hypothetical protein
MPLQELLPGFQDGDSHYSTAFTRNIQQTTCPNEAKPCHVYATLPEDVLDGVFINFHANIESCEDDGTGRCHPIFEYGVMDTLLDVGK